MSDDQLFEEEQEYFYIPNENGEDEKYEIFYEFDEEETGYTYLMLIPVEEALDDSEEEIMVYPLRYKTDDEEPVYEALETDEEWNKVEEMLNMLIQLEEEAEIEGENFNK